MPEWFQKHGIHTPCWTLQWQPEEHYSLAGNLCILEAMYSLNLYSEEVIYRLKFLQPQRKIQCQGCDKTHLILFPLLFVCSFVRVDFSVTLYALDVTHCSSVSFKSCMYAHFKDNKYFYIYMQFQFFLGSGSVYNSCTAFSFV